MEYVTTKNKQERKSGVELLKIIAMLLICIAHAIQTARGQLNSDNSVLKDILYNLYSCIGNCGNIIFVICSSYFLIDGSGAKGNKVIKILLDSTIIYIICFLAFLCAGYTFTWKEGIKHFFPDICSKLWFIPIYILFYMIHPLLNAAIRGISRRTHLIFCVIIFVVYGINRTLFDWSLGMSKLAQFAIVYLIVAYMKRYCPDFCKNKRKNLLTFIVFISLFVIFAVIKIRFKLSSMNLILFYSPLLLPALLALFNLFNGMQIKSKAINYFSSCSLFFYCIHENALVRGILRVNYYKLVLQISRSAYVGWIALCALIWFVGGFLLAVVYKLTISRLTAILADKLNALFNKAIDLLMTKTEKKNRDELDEVAAT